MDMDTAPTSPSSSDAMNAIEGRIGELEQDLLASEIAAEIDVQDRFKKVADRLLLCESRLQAAQKQMNTRVGQLQAYVRKLVLRLCAQEHGLTREQLKNQSQDQKEQLVIKAFLEDAEAGLIGIQIAKPKPEAEHAEVDCESLLPLCHGACCWLNVPLTVDEVKAGRFAINCEMPFFMVTHPSKQCLHHADDKCAIYKERPMVCRIYRCKGDRRVWTDFDRKIVGPLPRRIESLRKGNVDLNGQTAPAVKEVE